MSPLIGVPDRSSSCYEGRYKRRKRMHITAKKSTILSAALIAGSLSLAVSLGSVLAQGVPDFAAIIAAPDRAASDRDIDKRRDPVKLLAFTGVRTGMTVLDMGDGGGYSTELMARSAGPSGKVYGQNPADLGGRAKERFDARMQTPAMKTVTSLARPFDDPLPADVRDLDLVTFFFFYHDTTYMPVDRAEMNRKLYAALKLGGMLVVADHSAKTGADTSVGKRLYRIGERPLRREVEL